MRPLGQHATEPEPSVQNVVMHGDQAQYDIPAEMPAAQLAGWFPHAT